MDKRIMVKLTCGRSISGVLRGVDQFLSIVLTDAMNETKNPNIQSVGENEEGDMTTGQGSKAVLGTVVVKGSMVVDMFPQRE